MKNFWLALILLVFGGCFGVHHFYLGRVRHGVVYLFTFGCYGVGVLHDFIRLSYYVRWANFDADFKAEYVAMIREKPEPKLSFGRLISLAFLPQMFGGIVRYALPEELLNTYVHIGLTSVVLPFATAFVVWYVCNIGEFEASFRAALRGAFYMFPLYLIAPKSSTIDLISAQLAQRTIRSTLKFRLRPERKTSLLYDCGHVLAVFTFFTLLFVSMLTFSCTIEKDGEEVKCRHALRHFFTSPLWQDIVTSMRSIKTSIQEDGWEHFWKTLVVLMDPTGELHAYRVLGVDKDTSDDDIRRAYRRLSKQYHPDKNLYKTPQEAEQTELMFMEVQQAFEILQLKKSKVS